jgi:hypothetical protein
VVYFVPETALLFSSIFSSIARASSSDVPAELWITPSRLHCRMVDGMAPTGHPRRREFPEAAAAIAAAKPHAAYYERLAARPSFQNITPPPPPPRQARP